MGKQTSTRGGTPPYLAPYFAAKAGMDALAVSYAGELARWNIETVIVFRAPSRPEQITSPMPDLQRIRRGSKSTSPTSKPEQIMKGFASTVPENADVSDVAKAIVNVVDTPFGQRPFRIHIDPAQDGAEIVNGVADRVRAELLRKMGLADLLKPAIRDVTDAT